LLYRVGHQTLVGQDGMQADHWVLVRSYMPQQLLHLAPALVETPLSQPSLGDSIMVLKEQWLELILSKRKVLEIRSANRVPGVYFLGCKHLIDGVATHLIHGVATTLPAERIPSFARFAALLPLHQYEQLESMPYRNTWALPLRDVRRIHPPIPYVHHHGSIGWCRFEPVPGEVVGDEDPASAASPFVAAARAP
jgi:hypothetical protein